MEIDRGQYLRFAGFAVLVIALGLIVAGSGVMLAIASRAAGDAQGDAQRVLARLAWLSAAILALALLLLLWAVMRYFARRIPRSARRPTDYVDAWTVAGQRFQVPDDGKEGHGREGGQVEGP